VRYDKYFNFVRFVCEFGRGGKVRFEGRKYEEKWRNLSNILRVVSKRINKLMHMITIFLILKII